MALEATSAAGRALGLATCSRAILPSTWCQRAVRRTGAWGDPACRKRPATKMWIDGRTISVREDFSVTDRQDGGRACDRHDRSALSSDRGPDRWARGLQAAAG